MIIINRSTVLSTQGDIKLLLYCIFIKKSLHSTNNLVSFTAVVWARHAMCTRTLHDEPRRRLRRRVPPILTSMGLKVTLCEKKHVGCLPVRSMVIPAPPRVNFLSKEETNITQCRDQPFNLLIEVQ